METDPDTCFEYVRLCLPYATIIQLIRPDGEKIIYQTQYDNEDAVLIYIPVMGKIYEDLWKTMEEYLPEETEPAMGACISSEPTSVADGTVMDQMRVEKIPSVKENLETVNNHLKRMNMDQTEKYRAYRSERERKQSRKLLLMGSIAFGGLLFLTVLGQAWLEVNVIGMVAALQGAVLIVYFIYAQIELKRWKMESEEAYEYVIEKVTVEKKRELVRENGEKVTYKVKNEKRNIFVEGEEVLLVYVPQCRKVYVEKLEKWEEIVERIEKF